MKHVYLKLKSVIAVFALTVFGAHAQNCIQTQQYPASTTVAIAGTGTTNIASCTFAGEYSSNSFSVAGAYLITSSGSSGSYITITDNSSNVLISGTAPLSVIIPSVGIYQTHISLNSSCATENVCRNVNVVKIPGCIQPSLFPAATINISGTGTTNVTGCTPAGEYSVNNFTLAGAYLFTSTGPGGNYITVTDNSNNILLSGTSPLALAIPSVGLYRIHISTSSACGTDNACHAVSVEKTPGCNQPTQYPASTTVAIAGTGTTNISTCTFAGEFSSTSFSVAGAYTVDATGGTSNYVTVTDNSNTYINSGTPPLAITIPSVGVYRIHISMNAACNTENACRNVSVIAPPLDNDDCANAILLAVPGSTAGTTIGATSESPSPGGCNTSLNQPGVWYKVVGNGNVFGANLCSTASWDSKLFVYTGSCGSWTCVTGNDDSGPACPTSAAASVTWCSVPTTTYYILVTGFSSEDAFTITTTQSVVVTPTVSVAMSSSSICPGTSATLTASGAVNYQWSTGATTASISVSPSASSIYTITGTTCASDTKTVEVTVLSSPTITVFSGAICSGGSFTITPSGASTYTISGGSAVVSPATTTAYSVTGTSSAGCVSSNTAISTVSVVSSLTVGITGPSAICNGETLTLTANGASTYSWNTGQTTTTMSSNPATTTSYTVTGQSGSCTNTAQISVTVNPLPSVNVVSTSSLLCTGQSASLTASGANTYTWNTGSSSSVIVVSPTTTTNYSVTATGTNGCMNSAAITQSVSPCTGVEKYAKATHIRVYPNPNNGVFTVEGTEGSYVQVLNTIGQRVIYTDLSRSGNLVDLSQFSNGLYFIQILDHKNNIIATEKVIKH